jgi:hypothetical protein
MQMSLEERLVLYVLQHASQTAQTTSAVIRLTELDRPAVESLLQRLMAVGLCESGSIEGEVHYWAVPLSETPILDNHFEWLAAYCSRTVEVERGDIEATYETCGIVLLVAIVTGTRDPEAIALLTKVPIGFIRMIFQLCEQLDLWWSPRFFDLERTVREQGDDADEVLAESHISDGGVSGVLAIGIH